MLHKVYIISITWLAINNKRKSVLISILKSTKPYIPHLQLTTDEAPLKSVVLFKHEAVNWSLCLWYRQEGPGCIKFHINHVELVQRLITAQIKVFACLRVWDCACVDFTWRIIMSGRYCLRSPMSYIRNLSILKASSSPMCNSNTPAMKDRPWQ